MNWCVKNEKIRNNSIDINMQLSYNKTEHANLFKGSRQQLLFTQTVVFKKEKTFTTVNIFYYYMQIP